MDDTVGISTVQQTLASDMAHQFKGYHHVVKRIFPGKGPDIWKYPSRMKMQKSISPLSILRNTSTAD